MKDSLAIYGGPRVRDVPMPYREAFGKDEEEALQEAIQYYRSNQIDPPYEGHYERRFCDDFERFMGKGHADAVASGTISCYIAIAALQLPKNSDVLISPVTDSGPLNAIIMLGLRPVLMDSAEGSYNISVDQFVERVTPDASAVFVVHSAGEPVDLEPIIREATKRGIRVIEDCSQAPGATFHHDLTNDFGHLASIDRPVKVGTLGDIAAFSTMYRKTLTAGASGGVVYSIDRDIFNCAVAFADRGRPKWHENYDPLNPGDALFPSLNFNTDEFSCAIGIASLRRLQDAIDLRCNFLEKLVSLLPKESSVCRPYRFHGGFSPFYFPVLVDAKRLNCTKTEFAVAVQAEGIALSPNYECVISGWEYAREYMSDDFRARNAENVRDRSFNLFLNEKYGVKEVEDIVSAILKVEHEFLL